MMHVPRNGCQGGGVGLLYNRFYKMELQIAANYSSFESMEILLKLPATALRIVVLYRPPPFTKNGLKAGVFFKEFSGLLEQLVMSSGNLLLLGDFNLHVDDETNVQAATFLNLLDSYNLIQHVIGPTHKDYHTIDLVITREYENIIKNWSTSNPHLSDHVLFI